MGRSIGGPDPSRSLPTDNFDTPGTCSLSRAGEMAERGGGIGGANAPARPPMQLGRDRRTPSAPTSADAACRGEAVDERGRHEPGADQCAAASSSRQGTSGRTDGGERYATRAGFKRSRETIVDPLPLGTMASKTLLDDPATVYSSMSDGGRTHASSSGRRRRGTSIPRQATQTQPAPAVTSNGAVYSAAAGAVTAVSDEGARDDIGGDADTRHRDARRRIVGKQRCLHYHGADDAPPAGGRVQPCPAAATPGARPRDAELPRELLEQACGRPPGGGHALHPSAAAED